MLSISLSNQVWAPKEDVEAGKADYASVVGPAVIKFYEETFNALYPLPKMDLMYEPHKGGAMEVRTLTSRSHHLTELGTYPL